MFTQEKRSPVAFFLLVSHLFPSQELFSSLDCLCGLILVTCAAFPSTGAPLSLFLFIFFCSEPSLINTHSLNKATY